MRGVVEVIVGILGCPAHIDVLEFICSDHGVIVEEGGGGGVAREDIVSEFVESLFLTFVFVDME